jgi:hypothetical protein
MIYNRAACLTSFETQSLMPHHFHQLRTRIVRYVLCLLLPALLLAQLVGLAHQIAHAGHAKHSTFHAAQKASHAQQLLADFGGFGDVTKHSCAAFDAATISACVHSTPSLPVVIAHQTVLGALPALNVWAPFTQIPFLSRAPPQFA